MADRLFGIGGGRFKRYRDMGDGSHAEVVSLPSLRAVVGTFVAAAAENYGDNDVISNDADNGEGDPIEFEAVGSGKVVGASLSMSEDSVLGTSELFLFTEAPTATEMDDNAAFAGVGAGDQTKFLGSIAFGALVDVGAFSFVRATAPTPGAPLFVHSTDEGASIFGILVWRDAETNETAGMTVEVTLYVEP